MADSKRFLLRVSPEVFEALRRWADDDLRSINGQIEYLLADQLRRAGRLPAKRKKISTGAGRPRSADADAAARGERDGAKGPRARTQA